MANTQPIRNVVDNTEHEEGKLTRTIENQTAKVPSVAFLNLAFASMAISVGIAAYTRKGEWANFVGLWAPAFMLMGIYNKIVKQQGSDQIHDNASLRSVT
jgi:hypothetical protein